MHSTTTYGNLTEEELRFELVELTSVLSSAYGELSILLQDQQRDYLQAYSRSPGSSVAAKNREAQYFTEELTRQVFDKRAYINGIVLKRELSMFLLSGAKVNEVPFPTIGNLDNDSLAVV
jgi:hypothetical protein